MSTAHSQGLIVSTSPSFGRLTTEPVELLQSAGFEVLLLGRDETERLALALTAATAWIVGFEPVDGSTLSSAPHLRVVAKNGAGLDNFNLAYLEERGLDVVSVPGGNARAVAEYTMSQMLALARGTLLNDQTLREGIWRPNVGMGLDGRTLGIVGFGAIGRILATMASAFGLYVIVSDPMIPSQNITQLGYLAMSLDELMIVADFVSLHVPLTPATTHVINATNLPLMKSGSYLINNSRGGVVDESALVVALQSNQLAGAALDVFENEPLANDDALLHAPNLILSSHTSGYSDTTLAAVSLSCAQSILELLIPSTSV